MKRDRINEGQKLLIIKNVRQPKPQPEIPAKEPELIKSDSTHNEPEEKKPDPPIVVPTVPKEEIISLANKEYLNIS